MGRNRFVVPTTVRKYLTSDPEEWVEIREELNVGEQKRVETCGLKPPMLVGDRIVTPIDWAVHDLERAMIFLTAWNLSGPDNTPWQLNFDTLKALDTDTFEEINQIILAHVLEMSEVKKSRRAAQAELRKSTSQPAPEVVDPTST